MKNLFKTLCLALVVACTLVGTADAQQKLMTQEEFMRGKVMVGNVLIDTLHATAGQKAFYLKKLRLNHFEQEHYYFNPMGNENLGVRFEDGGRSTIYEGLEQPNNGRMFTSIWIDGTTPVSIIAQNIQSADDAQHYLYRVIKNNNQELIGWTHPANIKTLKNKSASYAYLGKFDYSPGQFLKLEIYDTRNFSRQDAVFIDWRPVRQASIGSYYNYTESKFRLPDNGPVSRSLTSLKKVNEKVFNRKTGAITERPRPVADFVQTTAKDNIKFRADDSLQSLGFDIGNAQQTYNYKISLKRATAQATDSINLGEGNSRFTLYREFWKTPGKYTLTLTPKLVRPGGSPIKLVRSKATAIKFTVLPPLNAQSTVSLKVLAYSIGALLLVAGLAFWLYRNRRNREMARAAQHKTIIALQLQSVRSQLNPHFIFNALAGVQNLINKREIENANKYLSKFAKLTRNVLENSNHELTIIAQEMELLNDYLLMEQMRFGFQFKITSHLQNIDEGFEIPAMLLQPFAENAVKHGVSALQSRGMVEVDFLQTGPTLRLTVKDNGQGFDTEQDGPGRGIRLCRERIALLNSIHKKSHIQLLLSSGKSGTLITIELQNWI